VCLQWSGHCHADVRPKLGVAGGRQQPRQQRFAGGAAPSARAASRFSHFSSRFSSRFSRRQQRLKRRSPRSAMP